jgi:hypothetical protein
VRDLVHAEALEDGVLTICADVAGLDTGRATAVAVVLGDPDQAAAIVREQLGLVGADAIVFASKCFALAVELARQPAAVVVTAATLRDHPRAALSALLSALGLAPVPTEEVLASFEASLATAAAREDDPVAREALAIYQDPDQGKPARIWCARTLLRWGDKPDEPPPEVMDITGGARSLVFGPYIYLPPGAWRLTASFDVDEEAAKRFWLVTFGSGAEFSNLDATQLTPGRHDLSIVHRLVAPGPAEFSLGVPAAAFHGELQFLGLTIELVDEAEAAPAESSQAQA